MSMRDTDLIHGLTFDFAFAAMSAESEELADWIKADLLPVVEEVLDQYHGTGRRRIERLEIDLGIVSAAQARSELTRRLSSALEASVDKEEATGEGGDRAQKPSRDMLDFLRSGTVPWEAAQDGNGAHKKLLRQLIDSPHAHAVLSYALRETAMLSRLVGQFEAQELFAAAAALFSIRPESERVAALAWAADELRRLQQAEAESFWRWFLPQYAHPASADRLLAGWDLARGGGPAVQPRANTCALGMANGRFTAHDMRAIGQGLESADFALLAPYWDRILAGDPQRLRTAHPTLRQLWLKEFDDDIVVDIFGAAQADCAWLIERLATVVPRRRLNALLRPAMSQWLAEPADSLAPQTVLEWIEAALPEQSGHLRALFTPDQIAVKQGLVAAQLHLLERKGAPPHAETLPARFHAQPRGAGRAAGGAHAAVDSKHFREPLRVLGPIFARSEIITISKGLNGGQFALLAPHWDRLLVLAPHWLRREYPRLARTWLAGFDDEVLIDILSVVQAECCALIERLASVMPREQLHAALRPSLARWFDEGLDRLAPRVIMDEVLRAPPGRRAGSQSAPGAPDAETVKDTGTGAEPVWLEALSQRGDAGPLLSAWPSIVLSQRAQFRRIWHRLSGENRHHVIECLTTGLSLAQQLDLAVILQPAVTMLMAELQRFLDQRADGGEILGTALRFLLHAEVACAAPEHLMHCLLEKHVSLSSDLPPDATRHIAAALRAVSPAPAPAQDARSDASASLSDAAPRAAPASWRDTARFGRFNSAQLHGLLRTWAGLQQAGETPGVFLSALEEQALCAAAPQAFLGKVFQHAMLGETIDLDEIGAACGVMAPAPFVLPMLIEDVAARQTDSEAPMAPSHGGASPLPDLWLQALPRRLADAMLGADLSALAPLWSDIVHHHPDLLREAAQRYLCRAEARDRLIVGADAGKMRDLLECLSPWAARLAAPLLDGNARFCVTLPAPLAPGAFRQRVLRFALTQAIDHRDLTDPGAWVSHLLRALLPAPSPQAGSPFELTAHVWYELLRGNDTPLGGALEQALFGGRYLALAQRRLQTDAFAGLQPPQPEVLQQMLTIALCDSHPALTDQLLADGGLAEANPTVFSAVEWQALARAQLPRQERAAQLAFWREFSAHLPAPAANRSEDGEDVQAAFAAAFGLLKQPMRQAFDTASPSRAPADAALAAASADTIALLLMREGAPDEAVDASLQLLTQRLLANADACADTAAYGALESALPQHRALDRLLACLPGPTVARLLCLLQPSLAYALPSVLRAIGDALPIALSPVPATLDGDIWRAIFEVIFMGDRPAGARPLLDALVRRLASQHSQESAAWLQQIDAPTLADAPASVATQGEAMAQLLQPLVAPQPDAAAAGTARGDGESAPFAGDANLRNAGLVLIAPYIERLFAMLDITRDGIFVSDDARQRGVHLLQYAITGEESTPEYLLSLNKLLCGMPSAVPVALGISVTAEERGTIDQMLGAVIAHWSAIGACSIAGLRETFLQREGCLYYEEEAWHLTVPQRTFDMLLDRLPWGYQLIKFSWMAAPLNVTWR
jgi:hypothetical protein